jgi:hypothetical protein
MVVCELYNGDKKAVIRKNGDKWLVMMYLNSKVIQVVDAIGENSAHIFAENFLNETSPGSPVLLKEGDA